MPPSSDGVTFFRGRQGVIVERFFPLKQSIFLGREAIALVRHVLKCTITVFAHRAKPRRFYSVLMYPQRIEHV
jgi:hypothetical protein